jgi:hypothetical protein
MYKVGSRIENREVGPVAWKIEQLTCSMGLEWREIHICTYTKSHHPSKGFFLHLKAHTFN